MIIEINGNSLSDTCDILTYYAQFAKKPFLSDLANMGKFIKLDSNRKLIDTPEDVLTKIDVSEFFKNLYFAGRCAFEDKLIPLSELKSELSLPVLLSEEFYKKMSILVQGITPSQKKK